MFTDVWNAVQNFFVKKETFHGFDLNEWWYLGNSKVAWHKDNIEVFFCHAFFFINKKTEKREYKIICKKDYPWDHPFIYKDCVEWKFGECEVYQVINNPSNILKKYMRNTKQWKWSVEKQQWYFISSPRPASKEDEKYQQAVKNQKQSDKVVSLKVLDGGKDTNKAS